METVQEKVIHLIQKIGVEEEVKPEASLMDDLGLESLQIYTMLSDLEILFSIRIPEKVLMRVDTVQDMVNEIQKILVVS